jgi:2',3'-cyclic-nucleotide 2'-phosphodiesterase (5'-nucleotidase family)
VGILKKNVTFEDQLKELKDDLQKFKQEEKNAKLVVVLQKSEITEDPSGAYTYKSEVRELKDMAVQREIALSG